MSVLSFSLLGRFEGHCKNGSPVDLHARKAAELLCFLLLSGRPEPREVLAEVLWGDVSAGQSRKYLRQAVWQLQTALEAAARGTGGTLLHAEPEWIQIPLHGSDIWLDVAELDDAYARLRSGHDAPLDAIDAERLESAIRLYRGDLLEAWYADWCIFERERYRAMYLAILERLISFCEMTQRWERGVAHAIRVLRREPAHERTHRQLMRLLYLSGDRTAALRQYDRCAESLRSELGVEPAEATRVLHEDIRADRMPRVEAGMPPAPPSARSAAPDDSSHRTRKLSVLGDLHEVRRILEHARGVVDRDIASLEGSSEPLS